MHSMPEAVVVPVLRRWYRFREELSGEEDAICHLHHGIERLHRRREVLEDFESSHHLVSGLARDVRFEAMGEEIWRVFIVDEKVESQVAHPPCEQAVSSAEIRESGIVREE